MRYTYRHFLVILLLFVTLHHGCKEKPQVEEPQVSDLPVVAPVERPTFSADSAYAFIEAQVNFGPRVPGTAAHRNCANWLVSTFRRLGWETMVQETRVRVYTGKEVPCLNIIASINPDAERRLLLCAHWDTRPFADQYSSDPYAPIDGADDGGSGVGVLLR